MESRRVHQLLAPALLTVVSACGTEVTIPVPEGSGGLGASSGSSSGGASAEPACDGCSILYQNCLPLPKPCPGAREQTNGYNACLCAECGHVCGDCSGEPTRDVRGCQHCWVDAATTVCVQLRDACHRDTRKSASGC